MEQQTGKASGLDLCVKGGSCKAGIDQVKAAKLHRVWGKGHAGKGYGSGMRN